MNNVQIIQFIEHISETLILKHTQQNKLIMKTITLENGKTVQISEESYKAFEDAVKDDWDVKKEGETIYYVALHGNIGEFKEEDRNNRLELNESRSKKNLEQVLAFLKVKNWADAHNGKFENECWYHFMDGRDILYEADMFANEFSAVYFSSPILAQQCTEELGEETIRTYLGE